MSCEHSGTARVVPQLAELPGSRLVGATAVVEYASETFRTVGTAAFALNSWIFSW
jgi:hypothetical protein